MSTLAHDLRILSCFMRENRTDMLGLAGVFHDRIIKFRHFF